MMSKRIKKGIAFTILLILTPTIGQQSSCAKRMATSQATTDAAAVETQGPLIEEKNGNASSQSTSEQPNLNQTTDKKTAFKQVTSQSDSSSSQNANAQVTASDKNDLSDKSGRLEKPPISTLSPTTPQGRLIVIPRS